MKNLECLITLLNDFIFFVYIVIQKLFTHAKLFKQFNLRAFSLDWESISDQEIERSYTYRANAVNARLDVDYGTGELEDLDLLRPPDPQGAPIHMNIHGGFWRSRQKTRFHCIAEPLVDSEAIAAILHYPLCPKVDLDEIFRQIRAATGWLWLNAANDANPPAS